MRFKNSFKNTCKECGLRNSFLYKKCRNCNCVLKKKINNNINNINNINKIDALTNIYNNLHYLQAGIDSIDNDALEFVHKMRWLYILITKVVINDCTDCFKYINIFITIGKNNTQSQEAINTLSLLFDNLADHIDKYEYDQKQKFIKLNIIDSYYNETNAPATKDQFNLIKFVSPIDVPDEKDDVCIVCLDKLQNEQDVYILPCGHMFHRDCITPWLKNNNSCPIGKCPIKSVRNLLSDKIKNLK
jgi:hypothetical protein